MGELVRAEVQGGVGAITLDSQHNRNALSRQLLHELLECLDECESARVIVLRHEGPAFCSGADLKERSDPNAPPDSRPMVEVLERLMDAPSPTIAAVEGAVRAGGNGLVAACDLSVVAPSVTFGLSEVRIGVAPAVISVPILRRVTAGRIATAMLTGEPFGADYAREIGLVTHVTDDVPATVDALCQAILPGSPRAIAATKRLLRAVPTLDRTTAFAEMRALSDELFRSADAAEGMAAFKEKRTPVWPATGSPYQ
jgi:enoyl-CoA hydratase/carnithine racemase